MGKIGAHGELAVPALNTCLSDAAAQHRKYAIEGLIVYGEGAHEAIPFFQEALQDPDHDTRALAQDLVCNGLF